jgi:hypothetical protein
MYEGKEINPLLTCSESEKRDNHIHLLLIENENQSHYVYIKDLSKLVGSQLSKDGHKMFICDLMLLSY